MGILRLRGIKMKEIKIDGVTVDIGRIKEALDSAGYDLI